jgi:uncharacterized Tic20 family protein
MKSSKEETNAFLIHLSALLGFLFPFGEIIIPLVLWKAQKTEIPFLNNNGKEAVNFNITFEFYKVILIVGLFSSFFVFAFLNVIGILFLLFGIYGLFELMNVCLIIIAASKAQKGETYQYPMTINFLK